MTQEVFKISIRILKKKPSVQGKYYRLEEIFLEFLHLMIIKLYDIFYSCVYIISASIINTSNFQIKNTQMLLKTKNQTPETQNYYFLILIKVITHW